MGLSGYRERQRQKMATGIHGMIEKRLHYSAIPIRIHGRSVSERGIRRRYPLPRDGAWLARCRRSVSDGDASGKIVAVAN